MEYKQRREQVLRGQDAKYVEYQAAQREAAIRADLEAAQRRAQEKDTVARFQLDQ